MKIEIGTYAELKVFIPTKMFRLRLELFNEIRLLITLEAKAPIIIVLFLWQSLSVEYCVQLRDGACLVLFAVPMYRVKWWISGFVTTLLCYRQVGHFIQIGYHWDLFYPSSISFFYGGLDTFSHSFPQVPNPP
mgnify:CR=1 FL=1